MNFDGWLAIVIRLWLYRFIESPKLLIAFGITAL